MNNQIAGLRPKHRKAGLKEATEDTEDTPTRGNANPNMEIKTQCAQIQCEIGHAKL